MGCTEKYIYIDIYIYIIENLINKYAKMFKTANWERGITEPADF